MYSKTHIADPYYILQFSCLKTEVYDDATF